MNSVRSASIIDVYFYIIDQVLDRAQVQYQVVLTKTDLVEPNKLGLLSIREVSRTTSMND